MEDIKNRIIEKIKRISFLLPALVILICIYGFIILYSAASGSIEPWAFKQMMVFAIFMPLAFIISLLDLRFIFRISYISYFITLICLILVALIGKKAMGAVRWLDLGVIKIQPSELAKITIVLALSRFFSAISEYETMHIKNIVIALIILLVPTALIIKQPDLGTGIITIIVGMVMFFVIGVNLRYFIFGGVVSLCSIPIIWHFMHNYQKSRILIFLNPELDPLGAGYNIIQSKIAIGSGGMFGKGLLKGTQSHLNFLPEYQTDFIFAHLTEELGFIGGILLILLYGCIIIKSLSIAINSKSLFAKLMGVGITSIFFAHIFVNIAMVMGLLPIVGVPLPVMSYGGTMMATVWIGFGLIMNVEVNQNKAVP